MVKNGRDIYPGANYVLKVNYRDGKSEIQRIELKYRKKTIRLNVGDIVERHTVDGDYVLFNRQPTLHKPSMMGHKVQVVDNDNLNNVRLVLKLLLQKHGINLKGKILPSIAVKNSEVIAIKKNHFFAIASQAMKKSGSVSV